MNDLQKNDLPGSTPDDSAFCDPLARVQARLSSYIAHRRDDLDAPLDPDDPDGLAHKVSQIAFHLHQFLGLIRDFSSCSPDRIESIDQYRREGGIDAHCGHLYKDPEDLPYQSLFISQHPTARDSDSEKEPPEDPSGGTHT
ncbi:MAG: hypothetical protein KAX24_03555 [Anaerolineae bacterium]|nr:hypothetical protein [Anaerolineae bacterium]